MNINKNPQHRANLGYNGFAMDNKLFFSSTTGELLPVYYDLLSPGDKVDINTILKTRTQTVDSAAMCEINENLDWFFVPMTRIYRFFPEFYYGVNDNGTSLVDMEEFGSSFPYIYFSDIVSTLKGNYSEYHGQSSRTNMLRLMQYLGLPIKSFMSAIDDQQAIQDIAFNPMFSCAYQTIYNDYYRLSDREAVDTASYNLDSYYDSNHITSNDDISHIFKLRYAPLSKDFYTDLEISPLFGGGNPSSLDGVDLNRVNQWLTSSNSVVSLDPDLNQGNQADNASIAITGDPSAKSIEFRLNTANIRTMFAVEKLLEITRRAGKHYDKQVLAHFGIKVPMGINGECIHICGSSSAVNIGDVIATADTDLAALGKVGGKGYGYSDNGHGKFEAQCDGILMCIYHAKVTPNYAQSGIDRLNTYINRSDFFVPEYDNLGMQPLFKYQTQFEYDNAVNRGNIIGWQYRYKELKQKVSRVLGAFDGSLDYWTTNRPAPANGRLDNFLASPTQLDNIMVSKYVPSFASYNQLFNSDPFIHELYFDVKKASKMSTYGLPEL